MYVLAIARHGQVPYGVENYKQLNKHAWSVQAKLSFFKYQLSKDSVLRLNQSPRMHKYMHRPCFFHAHEVSGLFAN